MTYYFKEDRLPFNILKIKKKENFKLLKNAVRLKKQHFWLAFAEWFRSLRMSTEQFIIFSDEAYFYLTLHNNKQNNRYWGHLAQEYGIEVPRNF